MFGHFYTLFTLYNYKYSIYFIFNVNFFYSYETLSGGDCADLKNIITQLRANDWKKATAGGFAGQGKSSAEKMGNFAKAAGKEDSGRI